MTDAATLASAEAALAALDAAVAAKPGGEERSGQREMCAAVARALETGEHLLVEAPTGTGKSLAYGIAAALHATRDAGDEPAAVVVTTATKALQEQLCDEDLPFLQRASGLEFTFALLKGRSNYLCPSKLDDLASGAEPQSLLALTEREQSRGDALARVTEWAEQTDTGDRAELAVDVPDDIWQIVSISARECPGVGNCHAGERCFAERARARARAADIVVVNTSLYAAHLASGRQVLPEHDAVIVDEAHLVEDIVADAFSADVHGGRFRRLATEVQGICGRSQAVDALRLQADRIDTMVTELAADAAPRVPTYEGSVAEALVAARGSVVDAARVLREHKIEPGSPAASRKARASKAAQTLDADLGAMLDPQIADTHVAFVEREHDRETLLCSPIDVDSILAGTLFPNATVVATSATLAVGGRFDDAARRFGLAAEPEPQWTGLRVDSPFDFKTQAILYVPKHLPEPNDPAYRDAMAAELHELVTAAGGRTLALFTSWAAMRETADRCAALGGYDVLRQGDAPRRQLVDRLKTTADTGGVAVFATMGFWTGVDVAGVGLTLVTIDRIPFPRPNEPLHAARRQRAAARGTAPFEAVDLPRAAIQLAQGTGRLVRSRTDLGVVAVLDRRLATARYRTLLLETMAPFRRSVDGAEVRAFLREVTAEHPAQS
ncbi:MAG: ATP-dependent DNA helicase [Acidimicrobiia bacterium]